MRSGISFTISSRDRQRLQAIVAAPKSPQKHVWRARIVLLSGEGLGASAIMAATGKSKTCVWRWQERFMHEGVDGLLRDRSRPPGKAPVPPERVAEIVRLTQQPPPFEATHWTLRAMAKVAGVAASTVQAIWKAHGLSRAGPSISHRPRARGSMLSRVSSPNSRGAGSSMASSIPSSTFRPPSTVSSVNTMPGTRCHSSGKPILIKSSPLETEGSKRWNQSTSVGPIQPPYNPWGVAEGRKLGQ